jgi:hypothetical protein
LYPSREATRLLCLAGFLGLLGCVSDYNPQQGFTRPDHLPRVRNVRPNVPNELAKVHIRMMQVHVRLDVDLTEAWSLASTEGIDAGQLARWKANGIRVGVLDPVAMSRFIEIMPRHGGVRETQIRAGSGPVALETTPTAGFPFDARVVLGVDRDETIRLPAGRTQLLADVELSPKGAAIAMSPHHHWVADSVLPRSLEEKLYDGRVFRELELEASLPWDHFLVLGLDKPALTEPLQVGAPRAEGAPEAAVADPPPARIRREEVICGVPTLGALLFAAERGGSPLQLVVFIRIPRQGDEVQVKVRPELGEGRSEH